MNKLALVSYLSAHSIEQVYELFGYDYEQEAIFDRTRNSNFRRRQFLALLSWREAPTSELVQRFFNQVNTFYGEKWLLSNASEDPIPALIEINRLGLFRQGKHVGFRSKGIAFGVRLHLPFMDAFRQSKWLVGIDPEHIRDSTDAWARATNQCGRNLDMALALSMTLIAIHPFADGNGRAGRLLFTWLCKRWDLSLLWLDEGRDGELLRTGQGIQSTEYVMAMFMIRLANGHNVADPAGNSRRTSSEDEKAHAALCDELERMRDGTSTILSTEEFRNLKDHFWTDRHFRPTSPRFECLRGVLD